MSVAKFVAANGREAMRQVREAMGPDAVVLSNRTVEGGVEIVAMRDTDLGSVSATAQVYVPPAPVAEPAAIGDLRGELQSMRAMLERQLAGISAAPGVAPSAAAHGVAASDPLRESLFEWLVGAGFSGQLARTLLARLPLGYDRPAAMGWIRSELASKLPVLADEDHLFAQGGVLALVGPTGVGKTTTTAKLAARFVLRHGADKLALLTTDSFRIGAHEQLRIYGDILGVPVHAVKDAADLRFALAAMKDKHLVIIDTVGMSQRDRSLSEQIAMLAGVPAPVQRVLLLNGASHGDTLNEVVHAYRHDAAPEGGGIDGCIISKLDEATHLGSVLDVVIRHRLPVFYASTGQRVPEHLELASSTALVERAFLTPRRGSVFADADAARRAAAGTGEETTARGGATDVLRSLTDSADALGQCVAELNDAGLGFDLARSLWQQRGAGAPALRAMSQQVREAVCRDVTRHCEQYVLAVAATLQVAVPGRRAPQPMQHTLWLADRNGMPLAAAVTPAGRAGQPLGEAEADTANLRAAMSAARKVVNLIDAVPSAATLARWQQAGERWVASARKSARVVSAGAAWKMDALADTLTFHAVGEDTVRERDAVRWLATAEVRVPDSPVRGKGTPDGGIDACLVVARLADRASGELLDTRYLLCDPALAQDAAQVARWALWTDAAEAGLRTLRHAIDHFAQDAHDAAGAAVAALQLGMSVLRLEHAPTAAAPAFLARLAGRTVRPGAPVPGTVLNEGMGRMLALLDVLENYPGRGAAAPAPATDPTAEAVQ
ncbi:putative flagellar biosynthesis protein, flagella-associated GTP-binding protein GTP-binding SRP family (plasmid) [Cupriavidus taiwanensis]|uniref:Flagellar biosynthesis protein FlhF n=2 Tax=Cupriavidus taiwanensis TaxID=164546 RepID=A0A375IR33_9BURK|nr:flagellar biosynthesis protein FlhF [Cupriavidus taiwanensis]SPK76069.1 putative flagellar biosynthesis protein, flagella-associated GTP-binding protein GTP-binding SRP family [Cupriavidus taiwanensis]